MASSSFTASWQAKEKGLTNLKQVSALTGVSLQTLDNWYKHKPELFETVLCGAVARLGIEDINALAQQVINIKTPKDVIKARNKAMSILNR